MAIVFITAAQPSTGAAAEWRGALSRELGPIDFRVWPDVGAVEDVDVALVWKAPAGALARFPNLRLVCSLGQGVDHVFADGGPPPGVAIVRLVDESMRRQMSAYVVAAVTRYHCRMAAYEALQREGRWEPLAPRDPRDTRVGVMGLGALGGDAARKLAALEFTVAGWARTPRTIDGIEVYTGADALLPFLAGLDVVCCLLPLTPETRDILDARAFAAMKEGAWLVNTARGHHVVEDDLVAALDSGHLAGATLDVFRTEPLPATSPLWRHPRVTITPHASAVTLVESCAPQVADNIRRLRSGAPLVNVVERDRGY